MDVEESCGKNRGKTVEKPWKNQGKTMETPWKNHGTANWMEVYSLYIDVYSRKSWKKQEQIREIHAKWRFVKYLDLGPWGLNFCGIRHKIEVNS